LGPTKDDLTKHTLCAYFEDILVKNELVLKRIEEMFARYVPTPINNENRKQALLPSKAKVLNNFHGTASGMWFENEDRVIISLPGVPFEMKALISNEVIPALQKHYTRPFIIHKTLLTYGLGESVIAERIENWENNLPKDIKLAYLPNLGRVRLRLSGKGENQSLLNQRIDDQIKKLYPLIGDIIVGFEEDASIEEQLQNQFIKTNNSLAVAESCTGGKISNRFTQNPGASGFFKGGVVAYTTDIKLNLLGVSQSLINKYSVVSAQVAEAMAVGVREQMGATIGISTTGNAGPTKGDSDADLGTVFIALASSKGVVSHEFRLGKHRERVIEKAVNKVMELLHKQLF
jgi:nicotinamide-nucleotide amidase